MDNPLIRDRDVEFLLYELLDAPALCALPYFADHSRETFDLVIESARRLAREVLYPAYREMDAEPAHYKDGKVFVHEKMKSIYPQLVELGMAAATRPTAIGGQQVPLLVATLANAYLMAANLSAYGYIGLTTGAAHLIEAFGSDDLRRDLMTPMYEGRWTGTMALTEPHAGSSLADVQARAAPTSHDYYLLKGSKIFISGGDHDLTENIIHMTLARIEGAPPGLKGVSLFAVPKRRREGEFLVDNDVAVAGAIHKIGWRGLPSLALEYGERGDCRGWLVGEPHKGIAYMFQMMNEARIMVGVNGVATASVAYHEALGYARERPQGRPAAAKDPRAPQVPIIDHADVRRMLLRQKAIVEGGLSLIATTARYADLAAHASDGEVRRRAALLLDLLTPVAKSFPAEKGFEANSLSIQIHGGYGYTSEYAPEAWWRDQKLNSIHEGTTGIQGLDLLGRKVVAGGGEALALIAAEVADAAARDGGPWGAALTRASSTIQELTLRLGARGAGGDVEGMLLHSADYLELFSIWIVAWQWVAQANAARGRSGDFYDGKRCAAQYWIATELPRVEVLAALCRDGEDSYARMRSEWF
jgi:butyryl-CoA dehydrogenase